MKQWKPFIFSFFLTLAFIATAVQVGAQYGLQETAGAADLTKYGTNLPEIVGNIIGTALSIVSVVFFILMIFAGFLWMTAHGKEDQEKKARDTIFAAIIGIIIILAAYAITNLVFSSVKAGSGGGGGGNGLGGGAGIPNGGGPSTGETIVYTHCLDSTLQCTEAVDGVCGSNQTGFTSSGDCENAKSGGGIVGGNDTDDSGSTGGDGDNDSGDLPTVCIPKVTANSICSTFNVSNCAKTTAILIDMCTPVFTIDPSKASGGAIPGDSKMCAKDYLDNKTLNQACVFQKCDTDDDAEEVLDGYCADLSESACAQDSYCKISSSL